MTVRVEVREVDPDDCDGGGNRPYRQRFRRVVVADNWKTPAQRKAIRTLRRLAPTHPEAAEALRKLEQEGRQYVIGDELDPQPGDTRRGVPIGATHPDLCGARTKAGHPCRAMKLPGRKRCRWHGGASTGPRTEAGKAKVSENLTKARAKRWANREA